MRQGRAPSQGKYYTAEIQVQRSELPLPCSVNLVVQGHIVASMSLLGMPSSGIAFASVPLQATLPRFRIKDTAVSSVVPFLQANVRVWIRTVCAPSPPPLVICSSPPTSEVVQGEIGQGAG